MTSLALPAPSSRPARERLTLHGAGLVGLLIATAVARRLAIAGPAGLHIANPWLALHLATVVPAVPIGAFALAARKGGRLHKAAGRTWAVLMMLGALSSFGVTGMLGHIGPIHILSVLTLIGVPRAILMAMHGDIARHRRGMMRVMGGLVLAGLFVFLPGRMLGSWLLG